jgi:hypothetical protein
MMARHQKRTFGEVTVAGANQKIGAETVAVIFRDGEGKILMCAGATQPTDAGAGYAAGCMFIKTGTGDVYFNTGTKTSCDFDLQGVVGAGSVTLAMLAAGITPSHIIVVAGRSVAEDDGDASVVIANAAINAGDFGVAVLYAATADVYVKKVVTADNSMTVTLSGNGGVGTQVDYIVYRAAA